MLCAIANEFPPARIAATIVRPFKVVMIILAKAYTHTQPGQNSEEKPPVAWFAVCRQPQSAAPHFY
jgi:hypothetical protein